MAVAAHDLESPSLPPSPSTATWPSTSSITRPWCACGPSRRRNRRRRRPGPAPNWRAASANWPPAADSAALSAAISLVRDAQLHGDPAAWITARAATFHPPDAAAAGVDLAALVVVRARDARAAGRAADVLLRSGAYGLVVLDLGTDAAMPTPLQGRLVQLALKHDAAVLCLTEKTADEPSLGSLVSLRAQVQRRRTADGFVCTLQVLKDKRRGPGWRWQERRRGPDGLH